MKKLFVTLALLATLSAVAFFVFGMKAQEAYQILASHIKKSGHLILQSDDYQRGVFRSQANATVKINWDGALDDRTSALRERLEKLDFKVAHVIHHGPFPDIAKGNFRPAQALIITTLDLTEETRERIHRLFPSGKPIRFASWVEFSGDSKTIITASPFTATNAEGTLQSEGLTGHIDYYPTQARMQSELNIPRINYQSDDGTHATLSSFIMSTDTLVDISGLNVGDVMASLKELAFQAQPANGAPVNIKLSGLNSSSHARIDNNKLLSASKSKMGEILFNSKQFGPAKFDFTLKDIDVEMLAQARREIDKINQSGQTVEQKKQAITTKLLPLLPALLENDPKLSIDDISFYFGNEQFKLRAILNIAGHQLSKNASIFHILQAIDLDATLQIPKALIAALPEQKPKLALSADGRVLQTQTALSPTQRMERLAQQGYFHNDGRFYRSDIRLKEGALTLNNKILNPLTLAQ